MNPVAMTVINPRKEYWPSRGSNQRPPVLKSATLPTELLGSDPRYKPLYLRIQPLDINHVLWLIPKTDRTFTER